MNTEVLLITKEALTTYSPISRNVDEEKIFPFVSLSQQLNLAPILGDALFEELQEQIADETLTQANKALLLKIAPYLALSSTLLALRSLAYTISEKGTTKQHSENSEALSRLEIGDWKMEIMTLTEEAKTLLVAFLCECREAYPLWSPSRDVECLCRKTRDDHDNTGHLLPEEE